MAKGFKTVQLKEQYKKELVEFCEKYGLSQSELIGSLLRFLNASNVEITKEPSVVKIRISESGPLKSDIGIQTTQKEGPQ